MHVHASPPNPNFQLNTLYAAEKAAAKRETERTRKKLSESASALVGEPGEACVVRLEGEESGQESKQQNERGCQKQEESRPKDATRSVSDWA
jgi:hypothetical protein